MILKKRLFLASSNELAGERDLVERVIQRKNSTVIDKGFFLEVVRWEELLLIFGPDGVQARFNAEILECDAMIVLFHKKVGRFTKQEFDFAYNNFREGHNPRHILVYFKHARVAIHLIDKAILDIQKMRQQIEGDGQFYNVFRNMAQLELSLLKQLELLCSLFEREVGYFSPPEPVIVSEAEKMPTDPNVAGKVPGINEVRDIANAVGMFQNWIVNPHLRFEEGDVMYFWERKYTRAKLEAQFRARRLVLEIADKNRFFIPEPGDLSEKSKPIEGRIFVAWQNRSQQ
ncbi:MAG: hypothetical protein AB1442_09900 [Nitrospirota bacterium]